jgi:hypothetical protein
MATNRPRSLVRRHAGTGLEAGSGSTLDVDLSELTPKTVPVMADSVAGIDSEASDASVIMTLTNCLKILGETAAGSQAASGLTEVDGVLKVAPTDETLVPSTGYLLTQNAAGAPHKDLFSDIVALLTGNGLTDSAGVAAVLAEDASLVVGASGIKVKAAALKHVLKDGTAAATDVTVTGMAVGDELISVHAQATKASVGTITDRTSEYAVGAGKLVKAAGTDESSNQLDIWYWDRT